MKKYITLLVLFISTIFYAQTTGITYQAVLYNPSGEVLPGNNNTNAVLANKDICLRFSIIDNASNVEYQETQKTKTDEFGMVNLTIGTGTPIGGYAALFEDIVWDSSSKKLQVDLDVTGTCSSFLEVSKQDFSAVPFAYASKTAENVTGVVAVVNGGTGASTVAGAKINLGLNNVDNTSDLNKPISTGTQTALNLKENTANKSDNVNLGTSTILFPTQNAVKTYVDSKINSGGVDLALEVTRATTAENTLTTNLAAEVARATTVENTIIANLAAEVTRATAAENTKENTANKSVDTNLGNSNILFPTQNAVKTYVDNQLASSTPDATTSIKGKIKLAGDLTGTADLPIVQNDAITSAKIANATIVNDDIANATITTAKIDGAISVVNGGTGADLSTSLGYIKHAATGTNFTTVLPIPATEVFGAVRFVNGSPPDTTTGNVAVPFGYVTTGLYTSRPAISTTTNGDIFVTSGETGANASNNGRTYISTGAAGTWNEVTSNQASTDARYVQLAGSTMLGSLAFPTGTKVTIIDAPISSNDLTNKTYVDDRITSVNNALTTEQNRATNAEALKQDVLNKSTDGTFASSNVNDIKYPTTQAVKTYVDTQVTAATPNASNTVLGKIQLAGDLSGSNVATNPVISNSAITTIKIADANVTNAKLEANAITTDKIKDGEVQTADIKDANITTVKIADANVTNAKLAANAVTTDKILDGTILVNDLANDAVETSKIKDSNITTAKIADANVTTAKIAQGAADQVLKTNTAGTGVEWGKLSAANLVGKDLTAADASITVVNGVGATLIDSNVKVTDLGITTAKLAASAVTTDKITDANVTEAKLAADAVTSTKIVDGTIATADLGNNSVTTDKIIDSNVTEVKLASGAVTTLKLANDAVTTAKIANGTIINEDIADATITTAKISGTIAIAQGGTGATTATGALTNLGAEAVANKATAVDMDGTNADNVKYPTQLAVKTFVENKLNAGVGTATQTALNLKEDVSNKSTDVALGTSNQLYPSQLAVKSYVDTKLTTTNAIASLTYLPNIATNRILGNTTGATATPQEIPVTGTGDVVLKASAEINTPTITSPVLNGTISGSAIVPVAQGGSGANMSTTAGYVKQATTGANFSTVYPIPVTDVSGAVRSVNGVTPSNDGNVAVIIGRVFTGSPVNPELATSIINASPAKQPSDIYVVASTGNPNNGRTFIYDGTNWLEVATDLSTTDARYVNVAGDTMEDNLTFPTGTKIILADAPTGSTDAVNKGYVDGLISSSATTNATTTATGKIQLAGDLTGTATAPEIGANKITFAKMQTVAEGLVLGRSSTGTGNIEALTTLPVATLPALTGDVTTSAGSAATTIATNAVTLPKIQNLSAQSVLLGSKSTGGTGVAEITLGTGLSMSGGTLNATGGTVTNVTGTTDRITVTNGATTPTVDISANYVGQSSITTLGTITTGTWNGTTISVPNGGTGATTLTGYVKGTGTTAMTASATIPVADITGAQTTANLSSNITTNTGSTTMYPSVASVETALALKAPLASPTFTGTPAAPTATAGTSTTQIATTAFVINAVAAATIADADATTKGKIQLAGDLGGNAAAPLVAKLQGTAVSATAPTTNQLLQYDGTSWKPVSKSAIVTMETEEFTPTAGQTSFTLTNTPLGKVAMFINGVRVPKAAVSVSGLTVTYVPASNAAYAILVTDRVSFDYIY